MYCQPGKIIEPHDGYWFSACDRTNASKNRSCLRAIVGDDQKVIDICITEGITRDLGKFHEARRSIGRSIESHMRYEERSAPSLINQQ